MSTPVTPAAHPDPPPAVAPPARLLVGLAHDLAAAGSRWEPLLRFDAERRFTTRLPGPDGVEVWLASWLPGQRSDLHDHGRTAAALTVVRGALVEHRTSGGLDLPPLELRAGEVAVLSPGSCTASPTRGPCRP